MHSQCFNVLHVYAYIYLFMAENVKHIYKKKPLILCKTLRK